RRPVDTYLAVCIPGVGRTHVAILGIHQVGAVFGTAQPAVEHLPGTGVGGGQVFTDQAGVVTGQLGAVAGNAAVRGAVGKEVTLGHGAAVGFGGAGQRLVPGQRLGGR